MELGERVVQLCIEPTPTGINDSFANVEDLICRLCQVGIV